ncbi:adenosylcobinamide-GDP ribazoletransferase [Halobacterium wangiae]|uniref:adenosylcobinamide-GDP ribazoletransferase n=1 Tax=Halobacterium wangiae TaxID=2902623 RepID=UPI001E5A2044|nr:adenosylcobinamide-GDP ribazoletransferase [Halobacterium wangiae]
MVLTALRGALGFLTRLPVGHGGESWQAFRGSPWAFPLAGYAVGALLAVPLLALRTPAPGTTVAFAYVAWVVAVTGINHLDGVADVGDAAVVHGDRADRHAVLKDSAVGVGAAAAIALVFLGLAFGALGVVSFPLEIALAVVVAAEVGAKLGMAAVACLGTATHEGLGSQFTERASEADLLPAAVVAVPAVALSWPSPVASGALAGAVAVSLLALWWVRRLLGGVSGDAFGLVNEVGRVAGLHAGVIVWTLS